MGPTCSGKTDLALKLIQHLPCEIISVDSAMIYRGMDIGTAKPSKEILSQTPHHLIDICDPADAYSAGQFLTDVTHAITDLITDNKIPLLVGGTMLYFHALQNGIAELPPANKSIREDLAKEIEQFGLQQLHKRLQIIDPVAAKRIHPNDPQRIQRALEVYAISGKTLTTYWQDAQIQTLPYHFINLAIAPTHRSTIHEKIATRFQDMLNRGFLDEVLKLFQRGDLHSDLPSIRAVGYRQAWDHLAGKLTYSEMAERSIIATRQLAKRQLTWLRSWKNLNWFASEDEKLLANIINLILALRSTQN